MPSAFGKFFAEAQGIGEVRRQSILAQLQCFSPDRPGLLDVRVVLQAITLYRQGSGAMQW